MSKYDDTVIVEIVAGEGGSDSKNFVHELYAAYLKYAKSLHLKSKLLFSNKGHIISKFTGPNAYHAFKHESGKHCCQRIPITESGGRKHTSLISVAVLPIPKEVQHPLPKDEMQIETFNGGGPGGQHQNKSDSAVRVKHKPTGIIVTINGRDQHANKKEAIKILTARVNALRQLEEDKKYGNNRKNQMDGGSRSNKIRTYNFIKSRVVDHRLNKKTSQIKRVMKGEFQLLF